MSFEQLVLLKLDEIQRAQAKHGERLATLEERTAATKSSKLRDGGFVISGGAVTALLSFLAAHWTKNP